MSRASNPNIATLAALLADPVRAQMAYALMDGRALTAGELARVGGITAQTASTHLAQLVDGGLLSVTPRGRHRYYRISGTDAAELLEQMAVVAGTLGGRRAPRTGPRDPHMRQARVCYDHLAGSMGVRLLSGLIETGALAGDEHDVSLTQAGAKTLGELGIDIGAMQRKRRPVCRVCIDWSERRSHLAGGLGAALLDHFLADGWAHRVEGARILRFTSDGLRRFDALLRD